MTDNPSDLSDDIVPEEPSHSSFERHFAPWHKVRKEFVRKKQWNKYIIRYAKRFLVRKLQTAGLSEWSAEDEAQGIPDTIEISDPLKCLVIPGDDLLDIRSLERDSESIKCYIRYLGFNERYGSDQEGTRIHIAHHDVTSLVRISKTSQVLHDRFQSISNPMSQAYRYMKDIGPFHVINLDLCDSLFPTESGDLESYYKALHSISVFQMKEMATPWLLFISSEVAPNEVNISQFEKLCKPTYQNIEAYTDFASAISSVVPTAALNTGSSSIDCSQLNEKQLVDLFGVAIGKALLSFCSTANPRWKMSMLGSHIYTINDSLNVSMLSLAYQFNPISNPPKDITGLSSLERVLKFISRRLRAVGT